MAFMDKLMFWKKNEMPDLSGKDLGLDSGDNFNQAPLDPGFGNQDLGLPNDNFGQQDFSTPTSFDQQPFAQSNPPQQRFQPTNFSQRTPQYAANYPQNDFGRNPPQPMAPPGFNTAQAYEPRQDMVSKDIEVLSYKIDTLKAAIDMVNQRLSNVEHMIMDRKGW